MFGEKKVTKIVGFDLTTAEVVYERNIVETPLEHTLVMTDEQYSAVEDYLLDKCRDTKIYIETLKKQRKINRTQMDLVANTIEELIDKNLVVENKNFERAKKTLAVFTGGLEYTEEVHKLIGEKGLAGYKADRKSWK